MLSFEFAAGHHMLREQQLDLVLRAADRFAVLAGGTVAADGLQVDPAIGALRSVRVV